MPDGQSLPTVSIVLHLPKDLPYTKQKFHNMIMHLFEQQDILPELIILDQGMDETIRNNDL